MLPTSGSEGPVRVATDGIRIAIRLTPRGGANRIDGLMHGVDGVTMLKVSVTAPPADGRANDALLQLLAREWHLPRRDLSLVSGIKNRNKLVHVAGDRAALVERIISMLAALPRP